ncbi:MAG: redoxin domain-containing protein [Haloarculaceae archaeon]
MDLDFDVVDLEPADHLGEGDQAPDFTRPLVNDEFWEDVALSDLVEREQSPAVLVFHPMDGAFPATYVWNEIRDRAWHERATVVGLSISTPYAHKRLIDERGLGDDYALYADPGNGVAEQYGIAHDLDGMAGIEEPRPAVFVLDSDRVIEYAWVAEQWPDFPDYDAVEDTIESF